MNNIIKNPDTRKYIYGILAAAVPLAISCGLVSGSDAILWLALAAAILGAGANALASQNTPEREPVEPAVEAPVYATRAERIAAEEEGKL